MTNKVLAEMEFASIISEAQANTQTGAEMLNKYKAHVMANESSCALVNSFIKEASQCRYDNGVNDALEQVSDYISQNKTAWALNSACEAINANNSPYNHLNINAAKQVEKLLEMEEEDIVKYIKAGALKNVMFCESFRNIAKQVYKEQPLVEATADYVKVTPVSMIENVGDGICFAISNNLYKMNEDKSISEAQWGEVSNTFKTVSSLLESNICKIDNHSIEVEVGNATYVISEEDKVTKIGKEGKSELTADQLRENNRLMVLTTNPRYRGQMAGVLEAVALVCENYNQIVNLDHASIYTTKNDKFIVIEGGNNLYATLLASNRYPKWTINENAIDALSFIKSKTNTSLGDNYTSLVESVMEKATAEKAEQIQKEIKEQTANSYRERIEALTEKFKDDPVKLAVLSKLAQELNEIE
jgi:hypothetical protein